jgi:hypothetical protein
MEVYLPLQILPLIGGRASISLKLESIKIEKSGYHFITIIIFLLLKPFIKRQGMIQ